MIGSRALTALALAAGLLPGACSAQGATGADEHVLVDGLELGHYTLTGRPTGCTVILAREGATGGVDVRGGAPGTRETDLLDPVNTVEKVNAVFLSGGSAYGLDVGTGLMRWLEERDIGFRVGTGVVPIVVGAILFDLGVGEDSSIRPGADCGYRAADAASARGAEQGSVGAGAGATVGKSRGMAGAMKGGIGIASITLPSGLQVAAVVAVNAVGDVVDPATGEVVAGVRGEDGRLLDARSLLRQGATPVSGAAANTTIGLVATNATLTKAQATKVAQMAQDGLARAIYPAHTPSDGDAIFSLATGRLSGDASVSTIGALAADMVTEAILSAIRQATGLPGLPAASELAQSR
ncbi:MAG: P1 family peptidase [Gemmatimonadota bacterium]